MVKILEKTFNKCKDDSGIQTMKGEILKSLETRFDNIEESELLLVSTCLDPRFKDKFFSKDTKRLIMWLKLLWTQMLRLSHTVRDSVLSLLVILQLTIHQVKFGRNFTGSGATIDSDGGKEGVIDWYLSEPLIDYKTGNPYTCILGGITTSCSILFWLS